LRATRKEIISDVGILREICDEAVFRIELTVTKYTGKKKVKDVAATGREGP
jgi:hypothetical protein